MKNAAGDVVESVDITVADYFIKERNLTLKYTNLPCLDVGRASKPVYLPIEVTFIEILVKITNAA